MLGTQLTDGSLNRVHSSTHNYSFIQRERGREGEKMGGEGRGGTRILFSRGNIHR